MHKKSTKQERIDVPVGPLMKRLLWLSGSMFLAGAGFTLWYQNDWEHSWAALLAGFLIGLIQSMFIVVDLYRGNGPLRSRFDEYEPGREEEDEPVSSHFPVDEKAIALPDLGVPLYKLTRMALALQSGANFSHTDLAGSEIFTRAEYEQVRDDFEARGLLTQKDPENRMNGFVLTRGGEAFLRSLLEYQFTENPYPTGQSSPTPPYMTREKHVPHMQAHNFGGR